MFRHLPPSVVFNLEVENLFESLRLSYGLVNFRLDWITRIIRLKL